MATSDGTTSFVAVETGIAVLANSSFIPTLERTISVPVSPLGETLTHDGRYVLAADDTGAVVVSVGKAEAGASDAVLGTLTSSGSGGIEVAVSPDDHFAFVTLEDSNEMAVFNLEEALADGFGSQDLVGFVPLGEAPVGMAISPDGRWLYATSEGQAGQQSAGLGTLSVVDLEKAESDPSHAVVSTVVAECSPVRVVVSRDGKIVWVTARESDDLLGFSASALLTNPNRALIARVGVGEAPVGLALVRDDTRVVVADSNRFQASGANANLAVVDTKAAMAGKPALMGTIPAGRFPREMALEGNTLLVTNYTSGQVEAVEISSLP